MDAELRKIQRKAEQGDPESIAKLEDNVFRARHGLDLIPTQIKRETSDYYAMFIFKFQNGYAGTLIDQTSAVYPEEKGWMFFVSRDDPERSVADVPLAQGRKKWYKGIFEINPQDLQDFLLEIMSYPKKNSPEDYRMRARYHSRFDK